VASQGTSICSRVAPMITLRTIAVNQFDSAWIGLPARD